jgi:hypothetical protein
LLVGTLLPAGAEECRSARGESDAMDLAHGLVYATRERQFIGVDALIDRLGTTSFVLLGEAHDDPLHHAMQRYVLAGIAAVGRKPAVGEASQDLRPPSGVEHLDVTNAKHLHYAHVSGFLEYH